MPGAIRGRMLWAWRRDGRDPCTGLPAHSAVGRWSLRLNVSRLPRRPYPWRLRPASSRALSVAPGRNSPKDLAALHPTGGMGQGSAGCARCRISTHNIRFTLFSAMGIRWRSAVSKPRSEHDMRALQNDIPAVQPLASDASKPLSLRRNFSWTFAGKVVNVSFQW